MQKKSILIVGSGGREHAIAWKLKQSPKVEKIYIAPGNAGTSEIGENVNIKATDILALADFAQKMKIDLTVVGQDDPLALGIVDEFQKRHLKIWGPSKAAARIEASKVFAKELMKKMNVPTAEFETFNDYSKALNYINQWFNVGADTIRPVVIKASGLALGKGVIICKTMDEAKKALKEAMVDKVFGDAGNEVVIEEFLEGQEFSVHVFCDGKSFKILPTAQDHKPVFDDGKGPNTGGMGTIAPVPWVDDRLMDQVSEKIVKPILKGLSNEGCPFVGLLYPGLIAVPVVSPFMGSQEADKSADYKIISKVIEFNARFGDPETQSLLRLMKSDLYDVFEASVNQKLDKINIEWNKNFACCIALASGGYPGKYEKGEEITGIDEAETMKDIIVFHAGTAIKEGKLTTNGGRVLGVTAVDGTLRGALNKAYEAVKLINFKGIHYRKDIGQKSLLNTNRD